MKHKFYLAVELLCTAALIGFIVAMCLSRSGGTDKPLEEVAKPVLSQLKEGQMTARTNGDAAATFGFDLSQADEIVYWSNEDIMDVSELLIVKVKDESDAEAFRAAVEKHIADQKNLYKNYAPKEYALLEDSILETSGNTVFYCTAENAPALFDTFKTAL